MIDPRILIPVATFAADLLFAGTVQGWRYGEQLAEINAARAQAVTEAVTQAREEEQRRIYLQNTRTAPLSITNTVQGVVIDNVWGDDADAQALAGVNCLARGCRWTNSTTGQSSVYGRHWEDAFTSTTAGRLLISCNEPLAGTADQAAITAGPAAALGFLLPGVTGRLLNTFNL